MSGIVGSFFNHRGSGIVAKLGTDGHTFNSAGAGKKAITEAVVVVADGVDGTKLADDAVDSEHYTDGSIDNAHIADDAIDSEHYAAGSIDNAHLADDAVDSDELAAGAVDTAHIADNQVTLAKMAGLARGKLIYGDASGDPAALAVGSADEVLTHDGTDLAWAAGAAGGISKAMIWHLDTSLTGGGFITANWDGTVPTNVIGDGIIGGGTPVAESSGIFTFGSTGYWLIMFTASFVDGAAAEQDCLAEIHGTKDDSTYNYMTRVNNSMYTGGGGGNATATIILDITDVDNQKVKFAAAGVESNNVLYGHGTYMHTFVNFIKLADT